MKITGFRAAAVFLASVLVTIVAYWPGLHGEFFFDDGPSILQARGVNLERLNADTLQMALTSGGAGPSGRPVAQLSFALNHYFSGFSPFAFKATNLAIHLAAGLLTFLTALRLFKPVTQRRMVPIVAGVLAAAWLLHPMQLLPVLHVVQRMTSLSALFLLAAFLLHIAGRERDARWGWAMLLAAWGICWPLSMLSKETGVLFPIFVLAWELILRRSQAGELDRFARIYSYVVLLGLAAGIAFVFSPAGQWLWGGYELRSFTPWERLLTESRVLWIYLGMIVFPRLEAFSLFHDDIALSAGLFVPWTTFPAAVGLLGLSWVVYFARDRQPILAFGLAWFLIGHLLESTFLPLEIAHEHRNYLPILGIALIAAWGIGQLTQQAGWKRTVGITAGVLFFGHSILITGLRAHQYGDEVRRTQIDVEHHPYSSISHHEAGRVLMRHAVTAGADAPVHFFARTHFEQAAKLDPSAKLPWLGLMQLNCSANLPLEQGWIDELARRLRETPFAPGDKTVLFSVKEMSIAGSLCLKRESVEWLFSSALANSTVAAHVRSYIYSWLADYRALVAKDIPAAVEALDQSLAIAPHNPSNRLKRAQLAYLQGKESEAGHMLASLEDSQLVETERMTKAMLLECIRSGGSAKCIGM